VAVKNLWKIVVEFNEFNEFDIEIAHTDMTDFVLVDFLEIVPLPIIRLSVTG